jgi:hypothetical protein
MFKIVEDSKIKMCSRCGRGLPLTEFSKANNYKGGVRSWCKECVVDYTMVLYEKNKARKIIIIPELKTCAGCKIKKPGVDFSKNNGAKDGLQVYCKKCKVIEKRCLRYGVTEEWCQTTLRAQGGACAICKWIPGPGDKALDLDHRHGGGPRGFLDNKCNFGIGLFKDDVEIIRKAIEYMNGPTTGILYKKTWGKHGVPELVRDKILIDQNYMCKICSTDLHNKKICIDHDHLTMAIRGALCHFCNVGLGKFDDSVELLANAIRYLISTSLPLTD